LYKQGVAASAGFPSEIDGQMNSGSHRDPSGGFNVPSSQRRVALANFLCLIEQSLDSLPSYLLNAGLPHCPSQSQVD
jgi:hypothetical protein